MIPEAAIEAVARYVAANVGYVIDNEGFLLLAKYALEAAAPHMLAEAFDQGQKSGMRHADRLIAAAKIGRPELPGPISPNPYRPTP